MGFSWTLTQLLPRFPRTARRCLSYSVAKFVHFILALKIWFFWTLTQCPRAARRCFSLIHSSISPILVLLIMGLEIGLCWTLNQFPRTVNISRQCLHIQVSGYVNYNIGMEPDVSERLMDQWMKRQRKQQILARWFGGWFCPLERTFGGLGLKLGSGFNMSPLESFSL